MPDDGFAVFGHGVASYRSRASAGSDPCRRPALWPKASAARGSSAVFGHGLGPRRSRTSMPDDGFAVFGHRVASYRSRASAGSDTCRRPALWPKASAARGSSAVVGLGLGPCRSRTSMPDDGFAVFGHGVASYRSRASAGSDTCRRPALWPNASAARGSSAVFGYGVGTRRSRTSMPDDGFAVFGHGVASYRSRTSAGSDTCRRPALWPNASKARGSSAVFGRGLGPCRSRISMPDDGFAVFGHGVASYRSRASAGSEPCRRPALWPKASAARGHPVEPLPNSLEWRSASETCAST